MRRGDPTWAAALSYPRQGEWTEADFLALDHQDFIDRMGDNVPGRPVPSKSQWNKLVRSIEKPLGPILTSATPLRASKPVSTKNNER